MADLRDVLDNAIRLGNVGGLTRKGCVTAVLPVVERYLATSKRKLQQLRASYETLKGDFRMMREQRDSARMAVHHAHLLIEAAVNAEDPVDTAALAEALADVAGLCPGCWRMHGLWCHPYGGPMADPDPTAYQRALSGGEPS